VEHGLDPDRSPDRVRDFSLIRASLVAGPFLSVPPLALVVALIVVARRHERETVRRHLGTEVWLGVLSPAEWEVAADPRARRRRSGRHAAGGGGPDGRRGRFFRLAIRLAMHDYHLAKRRAPSWPRVWEAQRWRWELARAAVVAGAARGDAGGRGDARSGRRAGADLTGACRGSASRR
jgi:hypothetical protein